MDYTIGEVKKLSDQIESDLKDITNKDLKEIEKKYLGKDGALKEMLKSIGKYPQDQRAEFGKEINQLKSYLEEKLSMLDVQTSNISEYSRIDTTAPFDINTSPEKRPRPVNIQGSKHPMMIELEKIMDIFEAMGFDVEDCRQLDSDYNMFEALNIPKGHPARDMWDTFWTDTGLIPPAQTSTMQNRVLKNYDIPIRVVIPGRTFRNEATDPRHEHTFYQVEGVYVDKGITMADMLGTIKTYLEAYYEQELDIRVQPGYFPFTEPSAEFAISCPFCHKSGCGVCGYAGWIELMGCGMVHPNVLREGGIDPEVYSGFAWGFGLDRLVMVKNGIEDVRRFHSGDLDFLTQFK